MLKKILNSLERCLKCLVTVLLIVFTIMVALQVISRYIFNNSLTWTEQTARYLFIWMILIEMAILYRTKANMAFDLVLNMLPLRIQWILHFAGTALILGFAAVYFYSSISLCLRAAGKIAYGIDVPINMVYVAQPVGSGLLCLFALEHIADLVLKSPDKKEEASV
jgi:TRAP-type C4-dicarboxylate transport system permease small subunit